jgi:hypothetical protein
LESSGSALLFSCQGAGAAPCLRQGCDLYIISDARAPVNNLFLHFHDYAADFCIFHGDIYIKNNKKGGIVFP